MTTLRKDIPQHALEALETYIEEHAPDGRLANIKFKSQLWGMLTRAAAHAAWFDKELTDAEIGNMKGKAVAELGMAVDDLYGEMVGVAE